MKRSKFFYWNTNSKGENIFISDKTIFENGHATLTKPEWAQLGINDNNADFEEVEK